MKGSAASWYVAVWLSEQLLTYSTVCGEWDVTDGGTAEVSTAYDWSSDSWNPFLLNTRDNYLHFSWARMRLIADGGLDVQWPGPQA